MLKKLIIFDMGNTLLNFHKGLFSDHEKDLIGLTHLKNYLEKEYRIYISVSDLKTKFLDKWYGDFYLRKEKLIELNFDDYLLRGLQTNKKINFDNCMKEFYKQYVEDSICASGAKEILKYLKSNGYSIKIISNCILKDEIYIEVFKKHGLDEYIDKYIFSYSRKIRKPNLKLFEEAIEGYNGNLKDILMIGDNFKADIEPAKKIGITGVLYLEDKEMKVNNDCKYTINKLKDIKEILNSHNTATDETDSLTKASTSK